MADKATGRVVAVIVLLIAVAAALRGYLPGSEGTHNQETDSPGALLFVVALLGVTIAIVAVAIITRLRDPRMAAHSAGELNNRFGGGGVRPAWRVLLIALGVLVAWLLIVWLVSRMMAPHNIGQLPVQPEPNATPTPGSDTAPRPGPRREPHTDVLGYLLVSTAVLVLLTVVSALAEVRRRRRIPKADIIAAGPYEPAAPATRPETLVRAAELGLAEIGNLSREPRAAIIACYAAMERELANVPEAIPQDSDTPTEVLTRAVEHHALHADNAAGLVNLFEEARFSPHVMNEAHREVAVEVLQLVLAEVRSLA